MMNQFDTGLDDLKIMRVLTSEGKSPWGSKRRNLFCSDAAHYTRKAVALVAMTNIFEPRTITLNLYHGMGNAAHDAIQNKLKDAGILHMAEGYLKIPQLGNLGGYVDAVVNIDGRLSVIEIKTCGKLPTLPRPEHAAQGALYGAVLGIKDVYILYVSRSVADWQGNPLIRLLKVDPEQQPKALMRTAYAAKCLSARIIPPTPSYIDNSKCRFCPFKEACNDNEILESMLDPGWIVSPSASALKEIRQSSREVANTFESGIHLLKANHKTKK